MERHDAQEGSENPHGSYNPHSGDPSAPTNPRLLNAMRGVALNDNPETRDVLYRELSAATFLLPQPEPTPGKAPGFSWYEVGTPFSALAERDLRGRLVLPVFTDTTALFAWAPREANYVAMPAATLWALALQVRADAVVINVAGPSGGEVTRGEVQVLAQGGIPGPDGAYVFPEGGTAQVRYPEPEPPEGLVGALWKAAAAHPGIESVYLVDVMIGQGEEHLLAGIEFSPLPTDEELPEIMRALGDSVMPWVDQDRYVDFIVLVPGQPIEREVKARGMHVYSRLFAP
ncbi:MAG TPA: enhanced serine sensitivity protein SseB C-terminal domain-containing protein [Chloroflexia bacterium]|nr:enhanced serine sensitivity protein SseB C-terminal domain-containing protein [Chloroflexia bacterium]